MKERGILFSTEMVRAILDGRKTQTRRVLRKQPPAYVTDIIVCGRDFVSAYPNRKAIKPSEFSVRSPFGKPGDRLWVREAWSASFLYPMPGGGRQLHWDKVPPANRLPGEDTFVSFRADESVYACEGNRVDSGPCGDLVGDERWKPSIHMPRWASRITLEITGVRVERVQECSGQDAIAEGVQRRDGYYLGGPHRYVEGKTKVFTLAWQAYKDIWNHLNEKRGYGWDVNPWVWVIEFKRLTESAEAAA